MNEKRNSILYAGHLTSWGGRNDKSRVLFSNGICECITAEAGKGFPPKIIGHNGARHSNNEIIKTMDNFSILEGLKKKKFRIRKLTPRECFRLMGMKETDIDKIQRTKFLKKELTPAVNQDDPKAVTISRSQQYKMAGNSIVVDCLFYIFRNLFIGVPEEEKDTLF